MKKERQIPSRLSEMIGQRMEGKGISIGELAISADSVYEHIRRIVRGESVPSKLMLKVICEILKLPYKQMQDIADEAKIREKYGDLLVRLAGKEPSMEPLERVWGSLTESQQKDIIAMAQSWAKRSRVG